MKTYTASLFAALSALSFATLDASATAPAEFLKKVPISLSASAQTALGIKTATDLPVLVRLSTAIEGFSYDDIAADKSDIAFGTDDGSTITPYPYEIDTWNPNGESLIWVKVPSIAASTAFNMYYGNGVSVANTPSTVWSGYKAVWHMNEASGNAVDASGNGLNAVPSKNSGYAGDPLVDMVGADGLFGLARINATDATQKRTYLSVPAYHMTDSGKFTVSGWFRMTDPKKGYARLFSSKKKYNDTYGFEIECAQASAVKISPRGASSTAPSVTIPSLVDDWVHLSFVYDSTTVYVYANGALAGSGSVAAPNEQYTMSIGSNSDGSEWSLYGKYDEVRLMDGAASADRAAIEYAMMADAANLAYGAAEVMDVTAPKFSAAPTVVGNGSAFTFSATLTGGEGDLYMVFTDLATGIATTNLLASDVSTPGTYTGTPALTAGQTYAYAVLGVSPADSYSLKPGDSPVYVGELSIAKGADASEGTMEDGSFIVSRGAATAGDLVVAYTVGGTAVSNETYEALSGTVVIPDGQTSATIAVTPIYSASVQADVTVSVTLAPGAYLVGASNSATLSVVNSEANPYVRYVSTTGSDANSGLVLQNAKATLQAAIDSLSEVSADNDCTVYVAEGTYEQPVNVEKQYCVYITGRVSIIGMTGDPKDVVITRNSSAYALFNVDNVNAKLQYLTISNGKLWTSNNGGVQKGGGVYLVNGVVEDCIVTGCAAPAYGQAGVGIYVVAGRVSRCEIRNCSSNNDEANGTGICLEGGLVEDTLVTGCSCKNGGAIKLSGSAKAVNCTVVDNTGTSVAGIRIDSDTAKAVNCAIFGNAVTESMTRGVYTETRGACYVNCAADLEIVNGVNCLHCQPVFKDWANGDYRLVAGSPLLDVGASRAESGASSETDLAGLARVVDTVDIGCYENPSDTAEVGLWWSADKRTLPTTVTFSAGSTALDGPTYAWTLHNETTGADKTAEGQSFDLAFTDADAGTYTVSVTAGGLTYTSPDKLQLSLSELYVDAASAAPAFPFGAESPATTVQAAIDAAADGATIYIAPGTYPISAQMTISKDLRILGTGLQYTDVVITNTVKSANRRIFVLQHADAFVANLTMAGGYTSSGGNGGNLYISGCGGTVSNCWLTAGSTDASYQQGAAAAYLSGGLLTHSEITRCNSMPKSGQPCPRILHIGGSARVSNCLIHDCDYRVDYVYHTENGTRGGGQLINIAANGILDNCTIADVVNADNSSIVYVNVAQGGFAKCSKVVNCALFGSDQNGQPLNPMLGGTTWQTPPTVCFKNCVTELPIEKTYEKAEQGISVGTKTADESNVMDATRAACFADYANGDFRVKNASSPLVDAGGVFVEVPQLAQADFAHHARVMKKAIDIGCYEFGSSATVILFR